MRDAWEHDPDYSDPFWVARHDHAHWLRKREGLTLDAIGERLGVTRERARQMVAQCERGAAS